MSKSHVLQQYRAIHALTKALFFLGTPHRGSNSADWGIVLADITKVALQSPNVKLLRGLQTGSEILDRIHARFMELLVKPDFQVHSFQEDRGMFGILGINGKVVGSTSSKIGISFEIVETLSADHMGMARFKNQNDPNYLKVVTALKGHINAVKREAEQEAMQKVRGEQNMK